MSFYLLDTDIWIGLARGDANLIQQVYTLDAAKVVTCAVVKAELLFGARKSQRVDENLEGIADLLEPFGSLPFDDRAAEHYGVIRTILESAGTPIGANDMLIAAIALANDCVVVTRNKREFERVPGLRVLNWTENRRVRTARS